MKSACMVRGEECADEGGEFAGDAALKFLGLWRFDFEGELENDVCEDVVNFPECDLLSPPEK
jgi:hypothetical protein